MALEGWNEGHEAAQIRVPAMAGRGSGGQESFALRRARIWRHDPALPLCPAGGGARRVRDSGGPRAVARAYDLTCRRRADRIRWRSLAAFGYALPIAQFAAGVW